MVHSGTRNLSSSLTKERLNKMKKIEDLIKAIRDYSEIPDNRRTANRMFKAWADWLERYAKEKAPANG